MYTSEQSPIIASEIVVCNHQAAQVVCTINKANFDTDEQAEQMGELIATLLNNHLNK